MKLLPPRRSDALRDLRRRLAGAALALGALGAPATAQLAPPQAPAVPAVAGPAEIQGPVLPATLPPYDEGLRTIVGFAEEGRGDEALLWSLAYLDLKLPAPEAPTDESGEAAAPPAPQLPELPPAPELTESQRAALHYALAVILAGAPTTDAPATAEEAQLLDARERWALEHLARAEGLAGRGAVRSDANFNRGALYAWRGERSFLGLLRDVAASGDTGVPFPEDSPEREALIAARAEFEAGRDAALAGLRLGWEQLAEGRNPGTDEDLRANLEFCQRRLRQIDRLLELPPEEEPPEQEQQEDQPESEDSEDSQESEDSESSSDSDSSESESENDDSESSDSESESDSQSEDSESSEGDDDPSGDEQPQDSSGDPQDRERPEGDPDPESLEEREPPPEPEPDPEAGETTEESGEESGEEQAQPEPSEAEGPEEAGVDAEDTPGGAGKQGEAPPLSEEQVIQLLRRLSDIEKDQERLRALIRGAQRVPVEKDW